MEKELFFCFTEGGREKKNQERSDGSKCYGEYNIKMVP